jgi:Tol biopolymer transport system component
MLIGVRGQLLNIQMIEARCKMKTMFKYLVIVILLLPAISYSQLVMNLGDPINTENVEDSPFISADGSWLYFSSNRSGGVGGMDIWFSQKVSGIWTTPLNLGLTINSTANEGGIYIDPDGDELYFTSDRSGGCGGSDIWISSKVDGNWQTPVNMGTPVNSSSEDGFLCLSIDASKLYFSSTREGGYGGLDIWVSVKVGSSWSEPENLGPSINTELDEWCPSLSADGQKLFFTTNRCGGKGGDDIWVMENVSGSWLHPTSLDDVNTSSEELMPSVSGNIIFFSSFREDGVGMADIWFYTYD